MAICEVCDAEFEAKDADDSMCEDCLELDDDDEEDEDEDIVDNEDM